MRSTFASARAGIKRAVRRVLRIVARDLYASVETLTHRNSELRSAMIDLAKSVTGLESRLGRDMTTICRDAVRSRVTALEIAWVKMRLDDLFSEMRALELRIENELGAAGAQRSLARRELARLSADLENHIATCGRPAPLDTVEVSSRSRNGAR